MPRFSTAPIEEVAPRRKTRQPSLRSQQQQEYREALQGAIDSGEALVIELEPEDKALTIRNRIKKAAEALSLGDIAIRRRGGRIVAYRQPIEETN